jgi:branched-chain amino acid aminotransferase
MSTSLSGFVHLNGRLVRVARARVSVFDRGLLYGDGLFETLRAYRGEPFALAAHLARLRSSADFLGIGLPRQPWRRHIRALLERNQLSAADAAVRITVTRGEAAPALRPPARIRATVIMTVLPIDPEIAKAQRSGVRVMLLPFGREGFLAEHKLLNYLPAVLGKVMAARHGAFEGVFVDNEGLVKEGATSNVFVWRHGQLLTPPVVSILPGVTRRLVLEAAAAVHLHAKERPLTTQDLLQAEEAFLTSSLAEVVPVTAVDTQLIGRGDVGAQTRRLQRLYRQIVDQGLTR